MNPFVAGFAPVEPRWIWVVASFAAAVFGACALSVIVTFLAQPVLKSMPSTWP